MRKLLSRLVLGILVVLLAAFGYLALFPVGQQPDRSFDATVKHPAYIDAHPVVLFDEGHYNAHTAKGGYSPFAKLLGNDGYRLQRSHGQFTPDALGKASVLVIVNAAGGSNPKLFGINLVFLRRGEREGTAFTDAEVALVNDWVRDGGSLLLIADHSPFGSAAAVLGKAFDVVMSQGFTEAPNQYSGQEPGDIEFSRANGLLGSHPITEGRLAEEQINKIRTFTGQSLDAPQAAIILKLPPTAVDYVPNDPESHSSKTAQGVAFEYGRGRVVVLGEAAMLTAQIERGRRWGMGQKDLDNRQFALNVMHWLSHAL